MSLNIVVLTKQVIDPEVPSASFQIDPTGLKARVPDNIPPVVNGFDENAIEAALRIKDSQDATVTAISMGSSFSMDVMKKPLSMGADELILLQDEAFKDSADSFFTATVLTAAIRKLDNYDLIICGRQASDWDNAQVPLGIAELLGIACITLGRKVTVTDNNVTVERVVPEGFEVVKSELPTLVTVSNELGQPRYPTLRGIMSATRKNPTIWDSTNIGIDPTAFEPRTKIVELFIPSTTKTCEFIEGDNEEEAGRNLALKLRESKIL